MNEAWIVDNEPSTRYPIYTRGNVGEVFPDPVAPLSWTLAGIPASEPGWRDAFARFGAFDPSEFSDSRLEILGVFGGYCYLNVSISRIFGVRTPGLTPQLIDYTFFGEQGDAPPYQPQPTDESPGHSARIEQTLGWVLTVEELPELIEDQRMVEDIVATRPDLSTLSDSELVGRTRTLLGERFRHLFARHLFITYCATVPTGIIAGVCDQLGDPTLAMRLVAGIGGVDSATPSWAMWDLGRLVAASAELTAAFDDGVDGLLERLAARADGDTDKFLRAFAAFVDEYGSRGPNEWEMRSPTWGTHPELALAAIDRMRVATGDASPQIHQDAMAADREALTATVAEQLGGAPEVQGQFLAACRAASLFLAGRERSKTTIIKLGHEARLAMHEFGRRMVAAGHFDSVENFGMLRADELDAFLADPAPFRDEIRRREARYAELTNLVPPFIVDGIVPPISTWPRRDEVTVERAATGATLTGIPGCPGKATGRARVVLDPFDAAVLEPGDVLVAPITDPSWTPLFVPAAAVVVDVGAQISHAVIVSRELGIPCVVSVTDATRRIPDGATVTVDGTTGTVTIDG